jgi:hypothetical protein
MTPADEPPPFETKVMIVSDEVETPISERLQDALARSVEGMHEMIALATIRSEEVRAPLESDSASIFRIDLPVTAGEHFGPEVETHLTLADDLLHVWLAGAERLDTGSTLTLLVLSSEGESTSVTTLAAPSSQPIRLSLQWPHAGPPIALALAVKARA